jgi:hypothetical protein
MSLLKLGSTGKAVLAVEKRLKDLGMLEGPADKRFDQRTKAAVLEFKRANGWDDPKPVVREKMMAALDVKTADAFDGNKTPKKMNGASYNCEIGRNPAVVAATVKKFAHDGKLDFIQLQEISGYHKALENIPGYKLITFPGSKDRGETGVLVRNEIEAKFPQSIEADTGWTNVRGGKAQPRAATSVRIAGWLRVASVHAPPGIDWKNGHAVGADARVKSYQSLTRKLLAAADRQEKRNPEIALLIGGDWNEGASTGGPGSPSWLAAQAGMKKHAHHSIDWEMSRGLKLTNLEKGPSGGSDHRLITFTVTR